MRRLLILLCALACFGFAITAPTAASAGQHHGKRVGCILASQWNDIRFLDTRTHVQDDIFNGYSGTFDTAFDGDGNPPVWEWQVRDYCKEHSGGAASISYRRHHNTTEAWKAYSGCFDCFLQVQQFPSKSAPQPTRATPPAKVATCVTLNELQNVNDAPYPNGQVRSSVTALFDGYDGGTVQHFTDAGWIYDIRQYNHCSSGDAYDAGVWFKRPAGTDLDTHPFRAYNKGWNAFFAKARH